MEYCHENANIFNMWRYVTVKDMFDSKSAEFGFALGWRKKGNYMWGKTCFDLWNY